MASAEIEYRCFVGGLTWATESIINDRETGRSRGFRFVTFSSEEAMRAAIAGMDGQDLDGRNITVNEAQSRGRGGEYRSGGGYNRGGGDFRVVDNTCEDNISEIGRNSLHWQFTPFQKLNFTVEHVLKCLIETNVIVKGCLGVVYCAESENGDAIAVKKLWPVTLAACYNSQNDNEGVRDSFSAEIKTLGSIRYKNIVKFLGCCWNQSTRLLMYGYMPNGSLGSVLHEQSSGCMEWDLRYQIILGSAQGLAYLYQDCVPPIFHRDIKVNNILIGLQFEPYIADFGLAKLVDDGNFA